VLAEPTQPGRDIVVRGYEHATLAGGEQLSRVEGEGSDFGARAG
jgi:hypothetical protein